MKTRNLLLGAMGLLLMASCAKDEVVSVNHDGDEIAFNVVTNSSTRAFKDSETGEGGVYCNNNLPAKFNVWAVTQEDNKTYFEGDEITKTVESGITKWVYSPTRYWPEGTLDFYAVVGASTSYGANYKFNWNDEVDENTGKKKAPTIEVTVPTTVTEQKDLLYAVATGRTKDNSSGEGSQDQLFSTPTAKEGTEVGSGTSIPKKVNLNFRHALSQIVFTAQNKNPQLSVEISGITIGNVKSINTFTYPTQNTGAINPIHGDNTTPNYDDGSWGKWGDHAREPVSYIVEFEPKTISGYEDISSQPATSLTAERDRSDDPSDYDISNVLLLLPQTSTAWNTEEKPIKEPKAWGQSGTYLLVKCLIFNIAGEDGVYVSNKDVCLWGQKEADGTYTAKDIAIPVALNWEQGKKYIYNIIIGDGKGFNPDKPNEPIYVPIDFGVMTVDEFVSGDISNVPEAPETDEN